MHLTLHLTSRCNLRCRYCYTGSHEGGDMSIETIEAAIALASDDLQRKAPGVSLGVAFFGGEPLLMRETIAKTVRHCRRLEQDTGQISHFKVTTNGTLLDEAFLTDPDTSEVFVALSLDGVQAAHDSNRVDVSGEGTFARLRPKIELLLRHKPYSPVMMTITPNNVRYYAESVEWLYSQGFHYIICSMDYSADWRERDMKELGRQYKRLADWYYRHTMAEDKFYFSPFETKISSHISPGSCRAERCELGQKQISVAPNGRLYPCVQFVGNGTDNTYCIGHVKAGIDEDARRRLYKINAKEKQSCAECAIRERCNHFCACLNKQATGHLDVVSPVLCAHERMLLPIADALAAKLYKKRSAMFIQKHYNEVFPLISLVEDQTAKP